MPLKSRNWLLPLAFAAGLGLAGAPAGANTPGEDLRINSFAGAYLAARVAELDRNLDAAVRFYERALSFRPDDLTLRQNLMLALISKGEFEKALPHAERLKTTAEVERFSRLALAVDSFRKAEYGKAEDWLKLALSSDLDRLISGLLTAWAKAGAGNFEEATAAAGTLDGPEWYELFRTYHTALLADVGGRNDQAAEAYRATVENSAAGAAAPDTYVRAVEAYASFLARRGDKDGALAALDRAEEFAPGRLPLQAMRAAIEAGDEVRPLVATPADGGAEVLFNLATALNRGGGEQFVRLYLQYARALKPDGDLILLQLGAVAEQQQKPEEAISIYGQIPATSPVKRIAELQMGLNLADLDRHDEAIEHLVALLDAEPDDMRAYLALGGVHASREDFAKAAQVYDRAVDRISEPTQADWNIFYQRGIAYERLKRWPEAEPNFQKALELFPDQPQVLNYLGYSWVDMNINLDEGLDLIRKAVELRPRDGYIVDSLGWAYYRLGRYDDAVRELERAVNLMPQDPVLNDHLGDAYWRVGRRLEATFQWSHARDLKPEADLLVAVERKLAEGLKDEDPEKRAEAVAPEPATEEEPVQQASAAAQMRPVVQPAASPPAQVERARYTVLPGQSLWTIASEQLGDGNRYREILDLNPFLRGNPNRLMPGQELALPSGD
jgi:tetratricopeptide (TPR) repeat protein